MIRCFVAIPFSPPPVLAQTVAVLRSDFEEDRIRWVPLDQLHLTLRFFGDITSEAAGEVARRLEDTFSRDCAFYVEVCGLDLFYDRGKRPVVLWAGMGSDKQLTHMRGRLDEALEGIGLPGINKRFKPHLTLARIKELRDGIAFRDRLAPFSREVFGRVGVERIILYRSILKQHGPDYHVLKEVPFRE